VGEIGFSVGYGSEAAFSRAYKALFGHSPSVYYRQRQEADRQREISGGCTDREGHGEPYSAVRSLR